MGIAREILFVLNMEDRFRFRPFASVMDRPMVPRTFIASCVSVLTLATNASDSTKGAPDALLGYFGESPIQCMAYHRKSDDVKHITRDAYTFCGGSACEAEIVSHKRTATGYKLNLKSLGNPSGWSASFRQVSPDIFEETIDGTKPTTMVRCTEKDIVAGIGRDPTDDLNDKDTAHMMTAMAYAVFYASAVTETCEGLIINKDQAKKLLETSETDYAKFSIQHHHATTATEAIAGAKDMLASERHHAEYGVREDSKALPNFCSLIVDAFGDNGRVSKGLIKDPRKKA